ncbi:MAG: hypothetical protein JO283_07420 [Bradyrhizobium sp.]|nr:hypothetical protein [Bradyrhizobium sp.]
MVQFMIFDVSAICASNQSPFQQYVVPSGAMLIEALAENREGSPPWLPTAALSHFVSRAWSQLRRSLAMFSCASGIGPTLNAGVAMT